MSILSVLLQTDTTQALEAVESAPEKLSLIYLLFEGGVLMIPLLLCSILMVYVFFERLMVIRRAGKIDPHFMSRIREHVTDGNLTAAKNLAKTTQGPMARMIDKGLSRIGKPVDHIEKSMENTGKLQVYELEKNLSILSTLAGIAPMFGFLGTIAGMILLFFNIQHQGFSIENMAGGIYTKMVTSAVGLIIGLLSYVAYNYLNAQINKNVNKMEAASVEFLDILHEPTR
ncbi:MAG: MotA/TolQ/ExbB proton channel family protein [Chitinophagales bacterium]|nr:MotA/TolQ/ExbB proton channel family protein [Chitinophagaceae bacterium]MCB9065687.1 MotA/TolQ/ExbB proton channel family protein [Chitinophagales bacterium]